ncbi:helix-turn-helix transcriptional regulator [Sphingomonas sp. CGMCC 1.13654]|uniref:Helix-turn-helix transcriptional regulator n=2 Tax=Sphingomonas chungangi TaxID=2683589 RepID=A0A838L2B4_9SPHN|nr:helix-turn-helix transcriptional regulator [Sphingomonas chungangi]MVW56680.1 helix-turn-helix domain-containing protein [Sphingomonas chungangi]
MAQPSRYAADALRLMADTIRSARTEQRIAQIDLAERAGISRSLLARIERGDPGCAIGSVFEVAAILRIPLFGLEERDLAREADRVADRLALLPSAVRQRRTPVDDDF